MSLLAISLLAVASSALWPAYAQAEQTASLHLKKIRYYLDENGRPWLAAHFSNDGNATVAVKAMSPARSGPWTTIDQKVESGSMLRGAIPVKGGDALTELWVDSSQGLLHFDLPKRK
jgi:hypothetical protein